MYPPFCCCLTFCFVFFCFFSFFLFDCVNQWRLLQVRSQNGASLVSLPHYHIFFTVWSHCHPSFNYKRWNQGRYVCVKLKNNIFWSARVCCYVSFCFSAMYAAKCHTKEQQRQQKSQPNQMEDNMTKNEELLHRHVIPKLVELGLSVSCMWHARSQMQWIQM